MAPGFDATAMTLSHDSTSDFWSHSRRHGIRNLVGGKAQKKINRQDAKVAKEQDRRARYRLGDLPSWRLIFLRLNRSGDAPVRLQNRA
jgi:hypothetical protein